MSQDQNPNTGEGARSGFDTGKTGEDPETPLDSGTDQAQDAAADDQKQQQDTGDDGKGKAKSKGKDD